MSNTRLYHLGVTAPKRQHAQRAAGTTLADANRERPAEVFVELFQTLLAQAHKPLRRDTEEAVRLIDSTSVSLSNLCNANLCVNAGSKVRSPSPASSDPT